MKNEIKVPTMGESISEVVVGQILAPSGTIVKVDAEILELETDKVNQVIYAPQSGLVQLSVKTGDTVKIGQVIGTLETAESSVEEKAKSIPISKPAQVVGKEKEAPLSSVNSEEGIRFGKEAMLAEILSPPSTGQVKLPSVKIPSTVGDIRRPMSKIRKVIAMRMVEAQQTTAMLTTFNEVDLTQVIHLREKYKETFAKKYGCKLGFMSFFIKATLSALQAYPHLNSYIDGDDIVQRATYDMGIAVGTEKGVIVPVIRNCDRLSYAEIEQSLENFAKKARDGKITADDLQGGGFTITNGGVYGSLLSTPILLPPQCAILGMHKIEKRPVVIDDQITIRSMMYLALSYDHRLIDGKEAVTFLVHIKNMLEDPARLLLEI